VISFLRFLRRAALGPAALVLLLAGAPAHAERTVMVFGDSLSAAYGIASSQGWVALLGERIAREKLAWRVVNASVSGETTAGGVRRLPEDLKRHSPALVVIALGANDGLRGQPVAAARANLEEMIRLARAARAEPVLVGLMLPPNYGIEYAREFRELYPGLAKKARVPLVPFLLDGVAEKRELFQPDQLHPTAAAQPVILANVWPVLEPLLRRPAKK
jgi:acyl-CoA thioesterase-1